MLFLDTDSCIAFFQGSPKLKKELDQLKEPIAIAAPTLFEVNCGLIYYQKKFNQRESVELLNQFDKFRVFPLNYEASLKASEIWVDLKISGKMIKILDILIGAIIITNKAKKIITNDTHFKEIKELTVINY